MPSKNKINAMKYFTLLITLFGLTNSFSQELNGLENSKSIVQQESRSAPDYFSFGTRPSNSLVYSIVLPGAGHTYYGHEIKGAAISVAYFGSVVTAILSNNNFKAREERIEILTQDYLKADRFTNADKIWSDIQTEKRNRDINQTNRTIFTVAAFAVWAYGIVDLIYFTDDRGDNSFANDETSPVNLSAQVSGDFRGIALKINLP